VGHLHATCSYDDPYASLALQVSKTMGGSDLTKITIHDGSVGEDGDTGFIHEGELAKK